MKITKTVSDLLNRLDMDEIHQADDTSVLRASLLDAEKLADKYKFVKPVPYIVPIERAVGRFQADKSKEIS